MAKRVERVKLGDFWLHWRKDRNQWAIQWNDARAKTSRGISTGIRDFNDGNPPSEAIQALAAHYATHGKPDPVKDFDQASVSRLMSLWLAQQGSKKARAAQYGYSVRHWQRFFDSEGGNITVDHLTDDAFIQRFYDMRLNEGVSGETIFGDRAALMRALKWAVEKRALPYVPQILGVDPELRSDPKDVEYSPEQVAAILEAAWAHTDRHHVHMFMLISLSTHGRTEAILEMESDQIKNGLIFFNAPGRKQTTKKRTIVPIAPSLLPWIQERKGKIITYRAMLAKPKWADPETPEYFERPTYSIRRAFGRCLTDAGLIDSEGKPWGSPNSLRHTIHTYLQTVGVPQAQIDAAAGHSSERGSGRNYTHLRPGYLKQFIEAVEGYWADMDKLTKVHRRNQIGTKIISLPTKKAG